MQNTLQPALEVPDLHGPGAVAWEEASAPAWAASLAKHWTPGEKAARKTLAELDLSDYDKGRDFPARPATSRLSPHLRWGEV
ncbi:deoxyribodipyrimidine photo-lyase, partial [Corynebacterium striatum]